MTSRTPLRRWAVRGCTAAFTAITLATGMQAAVTGAQAATHPPAVANPYSPAYQHPYRHGVVPTIEQQRKMQAWNRIHGIHAASTADLNYGGGVDGIGVTTGPEKVYLVFYGSQWGTQGTNGSGDVTLSGDPNGEAVRLQDFFRGLGTGGELWSGVMTQYCDGVSAGSQSCPSSNQYHVAYPTGGALSGVWVDESTSSPSQATAAQLGTEAVHAASHFGNTTASSNRDAQYVVLSPTGTNPDNWKGQGFCAWHDWNGDSYVGVSSPYGDIAFTNFPYVTDLGTSCGQNFVNSGSAGTDDGITIVEGHEYAETVTDQNPAGGWTDSSGAENGDKCAWISPGSAGGSFDLSLTTGSFAVQTTWANDGNSGSGACEGSHAIVTNGGGGGNTVTVNNPGNQTGTVGTATSLQITATDSASGQTLTYSATGLPAGLSINSSTGLISGTPTTATTYNTTVTATDTTNASGSASFTWTINPSGGGGGGITNGGFETGSFSGWTTSGASTSIVSSGAHSGTYAARGGSTSPTNGDSNIAQTFTVPSGDGSLTFWYNETCPDTVTYDWATATLKNNTTGTTSTILGKTCSSSGWKKVSASVIAGDSYTLTLTSHDDNYSGDATYTLFDDVALGVAAANPITNGGFETGSFSGWTTSGASTSIVSSGAHSGTYAARAGSTSPTNGDSNIVQTFTAASGDTTLTFWYNETCPDSLTYDWATATLKNNTTGTTTTVLPKTCASSGWVQVTASIIAGDSYTLTLTSHDDNYSGDATYTLFDDVSGS